MNGPILQLADISQVFSWHNQPVRALDGVSLAIDEGQTICLVGESGCGKTTTGKIAAGLRRPTAGQVLYRGRDIWTLKGRDWEEYRNAVQLIHQDPYASLNPSRTVTQILSAPLFRHGLVRDRRHARERIYQLLELVDLTPVDDFYDKYPHQLSGGQRQRVSIARSLTVNPSFLIADEAVSMVDVSIRVSLLKTLSLLRERLGVGYLFITHDLAIAKYFAWHGHIGVMYLGRVVEYGPTPQVVSDPGHPYTRALLSAVPEADPTLTRSKERVTLENQNIPSLLNLPPACTFHPRCPLFVAGVCDQIEPGLASYAADQSVACHITTGQITPREHVGV
ncbi:MAG TPA: ABC transporter ATP-binding protein [Roseiflexaceae bacterium]|nr:ABC transporter ATP-binding protein [Roseiflexaceae bacterium]